MKLYDCITAPNPRRVRIFLAEKGVTVPVEQVDLLGRENFGPAFRAKNPLGRVPVLELDDGTCIAESVAICRYFEERHPDPPLMGVGATGRALVEMWQRRMELLLFQPITQVFVHAHDYFKGRLEQVPAWGEACRRQSATSLAWLDQVLADRPFVAGERYTIADVTALCAVDWGRVSDIGIGADQRHLRRWHDAVSARPSATV